MTASNGYAVFFFPQALEVLGGAIKPYLQDSPVGPHVLCTEIDTGGSLLEMTVRGLTEAGDSVVLELMVPTSMVRMIVSSQSDDSFGFGPRLPEASVADQPPIDLAAPSAKAKAQASGSGGKRSTPAKRKAAKPAKAKPPAKKKSAKPKPRPRRKSGRKA